ncbi:MAG: hypothetical protein O3C40_29540 [Planctomycetota bacterium]|nr:hypothetical protein [Planctomycetota bacterium]
MNRLTTSLAALAVLLFAASGVTLADGGHFYGGRGHHHHSGVHLHIGSGYGLGSYHGSGFDHYGGGYGLNSYSGHRHSYRSYGYSGYSSPRYHSSYPSYGSYSRSYSSYPSRGSYSNYGYSSSYNYPSYSYSPSYRTYSYYQSPATCSPSVIYIQPAAPSYAPAQQQPVEQYQRPEVGPTPPAVPTQNLPNPVSTQRSASGQFTSVTLSQPVPNQRSAVNQTPVAFKAAVPADELGPRLATPASRRVVSDDESPWVVGESTFSEPGTDGKIAATSP